MSGCDPAVKKNTGQSESTDRPEAASIAKILWVVDHVEHLHVLVGSLTAGQAPGFTHNLGHTHRVSGTDDFHPGLNGNR